MTKDWQQWHRYYDSPNSSLVQRLETVHRELRRALAEAPSTADGVVQVVSVCAGTGRDVLPVLAEQDAGRRVQALLIEIDPVLAQQAGTMATELGLRDVEVRTADAGTVDTYLDVPSAHVLVMSGVFGNINVDDMRQTIAILPALLAADGMVIWTRSAQNKKRDPSQEIRVCLAEHGFTELAFSSTPDGVFRVGMHRLAANPVDIRTITSEHMFTFVS